MSETTPRKMHHHGALKEALVTLALEAAQEGVVEQMSLRDASRRLGVSPGAVYRHFPDKDALMRALALRGFDMLAAGFDLAVPLESRAATAEEAIARFELLAASYADFAAKHYGLWRLMFGPAGKGLMPEGRPSAFAWLEKSLQDLRAAAVIGPPQQQDAHFAWSAIHGFSDLCAAPGVKISGDTAAIHALCQRILRSLRASSH
jgi:AcrR family transcriptional regulator